MLVIDKLKDQEMFTVTEKRIADYILQNTADIPTIYIADLAKLTYASHSAVIRLCKKIGCNGFREFKLAVSAVVHSQLHKPGPVNVNFPFEPNDPPMVIAKKMADLTMDAVRKTFVQLDDKTLNNAVEMISSAERVFLFSKGDSQLRARSFQNKLIKINKFVIIAEEYSDESWNAASLTKKDCAIFISYAGRNEKYHRILSYFQQERVPSILLTGNNKSPLVKQVSLPIITIQDEYDFVKIGTFSSQVSFEYILDTLFSMLYAREFQKNLKDLKKKQDLIQSGILREEA
ncbi:MurR/RpiR family transcriptional regulator [Enterococcus sp. BWB1-3]|uniref:MurR/RpiR family transcriptional regulator n=1 Tax=unclassified Enterococcus TaxID=2608891 RepID=UPI00192370C8|nr:MULTISPECIES: MurR/RpiR family transcriptional regulator [unclassified Enterococcus]MBL1230586.1 MurR/RpiR family transcriptional regulator [Enterococcus sp. BWB1-3]MCB5950891.1 MurR/RpiR family transcriptional regulator [Enterococcus sp. BWT-B8]MCB5955527.1 MurR/RpiR family transcriptional regulator [Enterococcus sp. CWB-B31]